MLHIILGIFIGVFTANFGEYWVHRLLHRMKNDVHINHHKENKSHGWLQEYWTYLHPAIPVIIVLTSVLWFFFGLFIGIGWAIGVVVHIGFSAYLHELCHTNPSLLFWMEQPIHYNHHKYGNDKVSNNFSFGNTFWDKMFGTYKPDDTWEPKTFIFKEFFRIKWF